MTTYEFWANDNSGELLAYGTVKTDNLRDELVEIFTDHSDVDMIETCDDNGRFIAWRMVDSLATIMYVLD